MGKKHTSRVPTPQELEALQKEQQKLAALEKEMAVQARIDRRDRAAERRRPRPKVIAIILLMTAVWLMYLWHDYYKQPFPRWFLTVLSAFMVIFFTGFLVYGWRKRRIYSASPWGLSGRVSWVYRDDTPIIYWFAMALYLFWDGVAAYAFYELLTKGSV